MGSCTLPVFIFNIKMSIVCMLIAIALFHFEIEVAFDPTGGI